ncbi:MAG: type III pantothenate kinase [Angelakisella sp.]|jgi:type III pantothenate kinase|nr:type III pantothenate kinase [Angelakisella sp.]
MILAIDIGNTNIVVGGYDGDRLAFSVRLSTDATRTAHEYAATLGGVLGLYQVDLGAVTGAIVSSVVPPLSGALCQAVALLCPGVEPLLVGAGMRTGLNIRIDNPKELGADLLAASVGAMVKYPLPAIVIDLGTATKIMVVDENRSFLGGSIMAGVMISLRALSSDTAQLPHISLDSPARQVIGTNTIDCMKSGTILGAASMLDGMIQRYQEALGKDATVVACGGLAPAIVPYCRTPILRDDSLVLDGLLALYRKNEK